MKRIGEMPEQQSADLQILGQLQSQLQLEGEALSRSEQQKSYLQSMLAQAAPVVDLDDNDPGVSAPAKKETRAAPQAAVSKLAGLRAQLAGLRGRYTDQHPEIRKLMQQVADEEAYEA